MRDMSAPGGSTKMAQVLADYLGPQLAASGKGMTQAEVEAVLRKVPVKLGGGKQTLQLLELMPSMCVGDLVRLLEDAARKR